MTSESKVLVVLCRARQLLLLLLLPCQRVASDVDDGSQHAIEIVLLEAYLTNFLQTAKRQIVVMKRTAETRTSLNDKLTSQRLSNVVCLDQLITRRSRLACILYDVTSRGQSHVPASGAAGGTVALATTSLAAQLDEWRGCSGKVFQELAERANMQQCISASVSDSISPSDIAPII